MEKKYYVQVGISTDAKGYTHQKCNATLPVQAIIAMDLFHDEKEDREIVVQYDATTQTITISKVKKA